MTDSLFEVVFQGKLVDGFAATDVKANVARLFKANPQQVEQMFSGKRVVIRNQLDQETALKYQALLRKNGAICVVERMKPVEAPTAAPAVPASPASSSPPSQVAPKPQPASTAVAGKTVTRPVAASESGRLQVAGKRVDAILDGVHLNLDPVGVSLSQPERQAPPQAPNVSHLSIAPVGTTLSENRELPPPIVPDVEHLSVAPPGTRLSDPDPDE